MAGRMGHHVGPGADSAGVRTLTGHVEALAEQVEILAAWLGAKDVQERLAEIVNSLERLRQG